MPLFVSTRSLSGAGDLAGTLEIFRLAAIDRVALEDGPPLDRLDRLEGLSLLAHGVFLPSEEPFWPNLAAGDDDFRKRSVRRMEDHLVVCAELGVARYTFMPGFALEETYDPALPSHPVSRGRGRDQLLKSLDRLAGFAEARGLGLALMNGDARSPEMLGCEADDLTGILEALQVPFLGIRLDVAHMWRSARQRGFDPAEFAARVGRHLVGLRLHEVNKTHQAHQVPAEDGPTEELLASHPEWHELPLVLDARGLELGRLLDAKERLEARLVPPVMGPSPAGK